MVNFNGAKVVTNLGCKTAEMYTQGGLKVVTLYDEKFILLILKKYNPDLLIKCAEAGLRVYLYQLAGYKVKVELPKPQTYIEALEELVTVLKREQNLLAENKELNQEVERQAEIIDELFGYSSIIRIAKFNGVSEKMFSWRPLKSYCLANNLEIKEATCPRYVTKKLWPHEAWKACYPFMKLPS